MIFDSNSLNVVWFANGTPGNWYVTLDNRNYSENVVALVGTKELAEHIVNCHNEFLYRERQTSQKTAAT